MSDELIETLLGAGAAFGRARRAIEALVPDGEPADADDLVTLLLGVVSLAATVERHVAGLPAPPLEPSPPPPPPEGLLR
jgi:hypothetical protein